MPAYLILDIEWHDPSKATEYRNALGPTLEKYGARTLVANEAQVLEGEWKAKRVVVIEFPNMDSLKQWYSSPEYAPLIRIRKDGGKTNMIAVERPQ
jgi:uncharacterized protein (DUF1330 family)